MNGSTVVPGDIFDSIREKDITTTFDMGSCIIWSVDGKSIMTDSAGNIDFSVKAGTNVVPADTVNNVIGGRYSCRRFSGKRGGRRTPAVGAFRQKRPHSYVCPGFLLVSVINS